MAPESNGNGGTITYRLGALERRVDQHDQNAAPAMKTLAEHEEQINGKRGIQVAIDELREEVRSLRRAAWGVGAAVIAAALLQQYLPT